MEPREAFGELKARMERSIIGQEHIVTRLLLGLLANGHLLVEGLPGLAKTRAVKSLAKNIEAGLSRIQFTPDLLPSDITGSEVYHSVGGKGEFRFEPGPIFENLILADEINRAPAKVQSALLEAMEERQVTVAGISHKLPDLFLVMATQNPVEQEGTYPLPEAQMDRFLMHVMIDYPTAEDEVEVVRLVRSEESGNAETSPSTAAPEPIPAEAVFTARAEIRGIVTSDATDRYIVDLVNATRTPGRFREDLGRFVQVGASPRGGLALDRCSRANAWIAGRDHVSPDDIRAVAHDCLRHRIMLSYEGSAEGISTHDVITELLKEVAVS